MPPLFFYEVFSPMLLSRYLREFPHPTDSLATILFSTRNGAQVVIDDDSLAQLRRGETVDGAASLADIGLLVDDYDKERREVHGLIAEINNLSPHLSVAIILGMHCNFACTYCYEGDLKGTFAMNDDMVEQLVCFLVQECQARGKTKVCLDFYGGEPFLYVAKIKEISRRMQQAMVEMGGSYDFVLVSNGSLMRRQAVETLLPLGLSGIRLTLDGPAVLHNTTRPLVGGGPSFAGIVANIKECVGLVALRLGGNYRRESYHRFPEIFGELAAAGIGPEAFELVRFFPVMQPDERFSPLAFHGGCSSVTENWLPQAAIFLREALWQHGYPQQTISPTPCMVDRDDSFTIYYDGTIYQCPALVGQEELASGDIWQGMTEYSQQYNRHNWRQHGECLDCVYLPLCFGGCRYMKYSADSTMDIDCKKSFLDAALEEFVSQDVRYGYAIG